MRTAVALAALTLTVLPAHACHHYTAWWYPWPQSCGAHPHAHAKAYVEVVAATPVDRRTPSEIADEDEHNWALTTRHDEINKLMIILRTEEDAAQAAGLGMVK